MLNTSKAYTTYEGPVQVNMWGHGKPDVNVTLGVGPELESSKGEEAYACVWTRGEERIRFLSTG